MTDKENNFAKDINVPSKEQIIIDGIQFNKFGDFYVDYDLNGKFQSISSSAKEYKILKSLIKQLARKEQECEKLKKQLMQKSEVDMFFNTPIEGWSNDPCGICPHKAENEELKERIKCNCFDPKSNNNRCINYNRIAEDYERDLKRLENKITECEKYKHLFNELDKRVSIGTKIFDCIVVSKIVKDIINKAKDGNNEQL